MQVLFVWTDVETNYAPTASHIGIAYLSAALKVAGNDTDLLRFDDYIQKDNLVRILGKTGKPDLLAFSVMTNQFDYCVKLATWAKEIFPDVPVLFGGHHPTLAPDEVIEVPAVDMICLGEGDEALVELVDRMSRGEDYTDVRNFWIKRNGDIIRNDVRPLESDIDALPFMDIDIFNLEERFGEEGGITVFTMAGRGCPFKCTYCCNPAIVRFYKGKGKVVRVRRVETFVEELKYHLKKHPRIVYFGIEDETFTLDKDWALKFCEVYKKEVGLPFSVMTRADRTDEELVRALADAHCDLIRIGVESGSEWLRRNVLKRDMTNEQIINTFALGAKYGIRTGVFAMMGIPHETPEMVEETIDLLRRCNPNHLQLSIFYPLPGTELYDVCEREGFLTDEKATSYFDKPVLNLPTIKREQITRYYNSYYAEFLTKSALKESYGLYDFLVNVGEAEIESFAPDEVKLSMFIEEHPRRFVIQAHPPTSITYRNIEMPGDVVLDFDIIMAPFTYGMTGGGVEFIIKINGKRVFKRRLNPKEYVKDRGWHEFQVDMKKYGGKVVDVSFITKASDNQYCTAGWGRPVLLSRGEKPALSNLQMT